MEIHFDVEWLLCVDPITSSFSIGIYRTHMGSIDLAALMAICIDAIYISITTLSF